MEVNKYNNKVKKFPTNIIANFFGFKEKEYFEGIIYKKGKPCISFIYTSFSSYTF